MTNILRVGAVALMLSLGTTGCVKKMLVNGQIKSTRDASAAIDTLQDYEVARGIAFGGLGQLEGMHKLAPDNEDGLYMLMKAWSGAGAGFIEDDWEAADDAGDEALAEYHRTRARAAYDRAIHYGVELLEKTAEGFEKAKRNEETIKGYLANFTDKEDAPTLLWLGQAWLSRVNVSKDMPEYIGELFVGEALVRRSVELDETAAYALGHVILGAFHARTASAELDDSYKHFQRAVELTGGKALMAKFQLARTYFCMKADKASYEKTLNEVVDAGDTLPEQRLQNTIAKRRARRYLGKARESNCGF
jgi:hypothetical protein